jgi:hypothetical protein
MFQVPTEPYEVVGAVRGGKWERDLKSLSTYKFIYNSFDLSVLWVLTIIPVHSGVLSEPASSSSLEGLLGDRAATAASWSAGAESYLSCSIFLQRFEV